jgi:hypothetical protein
VAIGGICLPRWRGRQPVRLCPLLLYGVAGRRRPDRGPAAGLRRVAGADSTAVVSIWTASLCRHGRWSLTSRLSRNVLAVEIMRGCPWHAGSARDNPIKRPVTLPQGGDGSSRRRSESYRNTGIHEISLLSLSTERLSMVDELMRRPSGDPCCRWESRCRCPASASTTIARGGRRTDLGAT